MQNKTNRFIQSQVSGMVAKTCWSMLFQRGSLTISEVIRKGYKENTARIAFKKFVDEGWAVKPDGTKNYIELSKDVTK